MIDFITEDFEPSSAAAWKQKIQFDLEGADYNETLLTKTNEGITIKPFYHSDNFEKLIIPIQKEGFKICQKITITNEKETNLKAIEAIKRGVTALKFVTISPFDIDILFAKILGKNIEIHFEFNFLSEELINKLVVTLKNERVFFNLDIIGNLARTGNWYKSLNDDFNTIQRLIQKNNSSFLLSINVAIYQNAGANTVQQIAYALAHVNEYLTKFGGEISNKIQFNFATGNHYFFEISKIRAFRYLYNLILGEYDCKSIAQIYSEPTLRSKTIYDNNINLLRTTAESMSAILGGTNTISNNSYDSLIHNSNEFGENISLNQLLILKEESHFSNAQNIANDSYYIESITKQLSEKALVIFKDIEKSGGFLAQLKEGTIQRKIKENAQKEQVQFDSGELILLGINKFPNEKESIKSELQINPFAKKKAYKTLIAPITPKRLTEKLEQKRLKNEA